MDACSLTLAGALVASVLGVLSTVACRCPALREGRMARLLPGLARGSGAAGLGLAVLALLGHLLSGHRPCSPAALDPLAFVRAHPAPLVAAALSLVPLVLRVGTVGGRGRSGGG